ncbi:MAG: 30S ribosome-binding factor RbfA [Planctomycetes bacterium]|nr:30S ribosome-binding factor RbfA [Planctomycetota bacterium]
MTRRMERVSHAIRDVVSRVILHELGDPRIGFVTVTQVKVAADLRSARVFYSVMGSDAQHRTTERGLRDAASHIQNIVADELDMKFVPRLTFQFDESVGRSLRISHLIEQAKQGRTVEDIEEPPVPPVP